MKRQHPDHEQSRDPIKDVIIGLANAMTAIEKTQRRFRTAVFVRLSRIETMLQVVHGAQIVQAHLSEPCYHDKMKQHAKDADDFISQRSTEVGLEMVKYVYDDTEASRVARKRRQKRTSQHGN